MTARDAMTAEIQKLPKDDPLWGVHPVDTMTGYDFPDFEPRIVNVVRRNIPLPDVINTSQGKVVSKKVRDEIERIEPGRHRFLSTTLKFDTDEEEPDGWSFLIIRGRVDCVALEASTDVYKRAYDPNLPNFYRYLSNWDKTTVCAVHRSRIAGRAIWYDYRINERFISDEFADFIQRENIRGWSLKTWDRPNRAIEVD